MRSSSYKYHHFKNIVHAINILKCEQHDKWFFLRGSTGTVNYIYTNAFLCKLACVLEMPFSFSRDRYGLYDQGKN